MARPISILEITAEERKELMRRVRASTTAMRDHQRAEIILLRSEGLAQKAVAERLGVNLVLVNRWCQRFERAGLNGLTDQSGRGRRPTVPAETVGRVVTEAGRKPGKGRTRWSTRTLAEEVGVSHATVHRIWQDNDLKPHLRRTFKLSNDPAFEEKFWDVIGLYLDPPERALVLCCDEKSQCQALERTQPGLPLGIGHIRTHTHDYIRHGTITLFAALNYLDGKLISRLEAHHTHVEWLRFLKQIHRETRHDLDIHLIVDNYGTHKHEKVREWLGKHPRLHVHFTPTSGSWMNLVERFFADLTREVVRDGSFASVRALIKDIESYLVHCNEHPKPYRWKAKGEEILAKIKRARAAVGN
jgi:transposase